MLAITFAAAVSPPFVSPLLFLLGCASTDGRRTARRRARWDGPTPPAFLAPLNIAADWSVKDGAFGTLAPLTLRVLAR
jgi:hypothetical protein